MQTLTDHDLHEIKLTLENTEPLYRVALSITDFDLEGEQIGNLYGAIAQQIKDNGGNKPVLHTDFDVRQVHELVAHLARQLQDEATK